MDRKNILKGRVINEDLEVGRMLYPIGNCKTGKGTTSDAEMISRLRNKEEVGSVLG